MNLHRSSILWAASLLSPILLLATPAHADVPNEPPSGSITSPTDGQMFDGPTATIDVVLQTSPGDEGIGSVQLLVDDTVVSTDTEAPYGFEGVEITEGMHTLIAVVVSSLGDEFPSEPVEIVVLASAEESGDGSTGESGTTSSGGTTAGTPPEAKGCSLAAGTQYGAGLILISLFGLLTLAPRRRKG